MAPTTPAGQMKPRLAALSAKLAGEATPDALLALYASEFAARRGGGTATADEFLALAECYPVLANPGRTTRRAAGSYYTPPGLVVLLANQLRRAVRVVDPACGAGHLLLALLRLGVPSEALHGIDNDPVAVALTRWVLALETGRAPEEFAEQIRCADALLEWPTDWPPFDGIIGNPPYVNAIEGGVSEVTKAALRAAFPEVGGTADLSFYFVAQAARHLAPGGVTAFILPRAFLVAPGAERLRRDVVAPRLMVLPTESNLFPGALVFVCAVALQMRRDPAPQLRIGMGALADGIVLRDAAQPGLNYWEAFVDAVPEDPCARPLGEAFEVASSMTAGEAYALKPFVIEAPTGAGLRLLNTGLIEPGRSKWGEESARYLGETYRHPRVVLRGDAPEALHRRVAKARRPKVVVAGLSTRIEALFDPAGEYIGSVGTFSLFSPSESSVDLAALAEFLNSRAATEALRRGLGGTAIGGGNMTLTRRFLVALRVPPFSLATNGHSPSLLPTNNT